MKTTKTIEIKDTDTLGVINTHDDATGEDSTTWSVYSKKGKIRVQLRFTRAQLYILKKAIDRSLLEFAINDAGEDGYVITDDFMDRSDKE